MIQGLRQWSEPKQADPEQERLYMVWRSAVVAARLATRKAGPGPATDTGERGERLEAERLALDEVERAKAEYYAYSQA